MTSFNELDNLVLDSLANVFNFQLKNFTFYNSLPTLNLNNNDLTEILDTIPNGNQFFNTSSQKILFTEIYQKILETQKKTPVAVFLGLDNFYNEQNNNTSYTYKPSIEEVHNKIESSGNIKILISSKNVHLQNNSYELLDDFIKKVATSNFKISITFNKSTSLNITYGNWFYSGAFIYTFQSPNNWTPSILSWDDIYNENTGILHYLNSKIVVVSGIKIHVLITGNFTIETVNLLNDISYPLFFSFHKNAKDLNISYFLESNKNISILISSKTDDIRLLGTQFSAVKDCMK
ncbi:hypothetical protein [Tenacibaculum sp. M341]|uniref:hypothetical protein n=1 Tax=Tenacibaculum sp. M341 TaxID=2530339 RepID=UPI001048DF53|nr:hypothetical protein [Tenacibaculum sp. M341]TCI84741.1 hypothetical protein EYW44_20080 [Tenacibaculum sp. M341]